MRFLPLFLVPALAATAATPPTQYSGTLATTLLFPASTLPSCAGRAQQRTVASEASLTFDPLASSVVLRVGGLDVATAVAAVAAAGVGYDVPKTTVTAVESLSGYLDGVLALAPGVARDECAALVQRVLRVEGAEISGSSSAGRGTVAVDAVVVAAVALEAGRAGEVRVGVRMAFEGSADGKQPDGSSRGPTVVGKIDGSKDDGQAGAQQVDQPLGAPSTTAPSRPASDDAVVQPTGADGTPGTATATASSSSTAAPTSGASSSSSSTSPTSATISATRSSFTPTANPPTPPPAASAYQKASATSKSPLPPGAIAAITICTTAVASACVAALLLVRRRRRAHVAEKKKSKIVYPELAYLYDARRGPSNSGSDVSSVLEMGGARKPPGSTENFVDASAVPAPLAPAVVERSERPARPDSTWPAGRASNLFFHPQHPAFRHQLAGIPPVPPLAPLTPLSTAPGAAGPATPFDDRHHSTEEMVVRDGVVAGVRVTGEKQELI